MVIKKHLRIIRKILPTKFVKFQRMDTGTRMDFLGQILYQWGYDIPEGARFPSELDVVIPYLTTEIRGKVVDTPLTYEIIRLDTHPRDEQERRFELLMDSVGMKVTYE